MRRAVALLLKLIGPAVLIVLLMTTDTSSVMATLSLADPWLFLGALLGWILNVFVKTWRWRRILAWQGIEIGYRQAATWYLAGNFLGGVSPGRLGELIKVAFIRDMGHPMGKALFGSVLDRLFDLIVLPMVAVAGMALYGALFSQEIGVVGLAGVLALVGLGILWKGRRLLALPVRVLMPQEMRDKASLTVDDFMRDFQRLRWKDYAWVGSVTAACWVLYAASLYLLALALQLPVDPVYCGVAVLVSALAGLLPVTVSGVGTRDAVLSGFFARVGLTTADAIALSTLILGLNVMIVLFYWPAYHLAMTAHARRVPTGTEDDLAEGADPRSGPAPPGPGAAPPARP